MKNVSRGRAARRSGALLGLAIGLWVASAAYGVDEPEGGSQGNQYSWGYALAHELMSPFCPGRTLASCPSPQAAEMKQWILLQEAAGATKEEVVQILLQRHGDVIRSTPKPEGWGLAAWLLPGGAAVAGLLVVGLVLRRIVAPARGAEEARGRGGPEPRAEADPELERLIDEELRASDA